MKILILCLLIGSIAAIITLSRDCQKKARDCAATCLDQPTSCDELYIMLSGCASTCPPCLEEEMSLMGDCSRTAFVAVAEQLFKVVCGYAVVGSWIVTGVVDKRTRWPWLNSELLKTDFGEASRIWPGYKRHYSFLTDSWSVIYLVLGSCQLTIIY